MEEPLETGNVGDMSVDVPDAKLEETRRIVEQEIAEGKAKDRNLLENFIQRILKDMPKLRRKL